jgi:glycine amidinotransferase/scyllo-inosamine-4-phosphate amidinotransferase 1
LQGAGIQVVRPGSFDTAAIHHTKHWSVDGHYTYCPRDTVLTIGNKAIATPMVLRHRQHEWQAYSHLFTDDDWVATPHPLLQDDMYDRSDLSKATLMNLEPAFDAANVMKCNHDLWFLISNTGNAKGAAWLQDYLGSDYRVHQIPDIYLDMHIDTTFVPLREGLMLCNPERVNANNMPEFLKGWDVIWADEMIEQPFLDHYGAASKWIGMNILSLAPDLVVVEESQIPLMKLLKKHGIDSMPLRLRHSRTLGGGPHCVTTDLVRQA